MGPDDLDGNTDWSSRSVGFPRWTDGVRAHDANPPSPQTGAAAAKGGGSREARQPTTPALGPVRGPRFHLWPRLSRASRLARRVRGRARKASSCAERTCELGDDTKDAMTGPALVSPPTVADATAGSCRP